MDDKIHLMILVVVLRMKMIAFKFHTLRLSVQLIEVEIDLQSVSSFHLLLES